MNKRRFSNWYFMNLKNKNDHNSSSMDCNIRQDNSSTFQENNHITDSMLQLCRNLSPTGYNKTIWMLGSNKEAQDFPWLWNLLKNLNYYQWSDASSDSGVKLTMLFPKKFFITTNLSKDLQITLITVKFFCMW